MLTSQEKCGRNHNLHVCWKPTEDARASWLVTFTSVLFGQHHLQMVLTLHNKDSQRIFALAFIFRIFKAHPDTKQLFGKLKDIPDDELSKSVRLRAHATGFMKELSGMMESLDDVEQLVAMIENNADRHHRRKVTVAIYEVSVWGVASARPSVNDSVREDRSTASNGLLHRATDHASSIC